MVVARPLRPPRVNSLTIAIAVGRQPPRPIPARNRRTPKTAAFGANAVLVQTWLAITLMTTVFSGLLYLGLWARREFA